jgi:hypothetical protein
MDELLQVEESSGDQGDVIRINKKLVELIQKFQRFAKKLFSDHLVRKMHIMYLSIQFSFYYQPFIVENLIKFQLENK